MNNVITISREFGSGGRELGTLIAQRLHIPFYDKELISLTAQSPLSPEVIEKYEERVQYEHYTTHNSLESCANAVAVFVKDFGR